jgi:hypothetical protein
MKSQLEIFKIILTKDVTQIITELYKLQLYVKRILQLIENLDEKEKEKIYQVAGDLVDAVPNSLRKMDILLSKILYALNIIWRKELKVSLPFDERSEVENLITPSKEVDIGKIKKTAKKIANLLINRGK